MSRNNHSRGGAGGGFLANLTPLQKKAGVVLGCCAAALIATIVSVSMIVSGTKAEPGMPGQSGPGTSSSEQTDSPVNDFKLNLEGNDAVLPETADAGENYLKETVFVGDSNTVRLQKNSLITLDQFVGKEGMGIQGVMSEKCVFFKDDEKAYTIPEALAMMKPRRIVMMLGTNNADSSTTPENFASTYKAAINAIKNSYSYTDIIVAALPPVPYDHGKYPSITMENIDALNQALADLCKTEGVKFLNTSEVLKNDKGYGKDEYFDKGDIHMNAQGQKVLLNYVRTHAYETKDRRPDTKNIPSRAAAAAGNEGEKTIKAKYYVEQGTGGTLTCGDKKDQTQLELDVKLGDSVTVTAVPADGYVFVRWSDGKTDATRTDKDLKSNVSVTAQFKAKPSLTLSETSLTIKEGEDKSLKATVKGGKAEDIIWFVNGDKKGSGESFNLKELKASGNAYKVKATAKIGDQTLEAEATVKVETSIKEPSKVTLDGVTVEWNQKSVTMTAKLDPADASTSFTWSASNGCTVKPNGASATIEFPDNNSAADVSYTVTVKTSNGKEASAKLTVKGKPQEAVRFRVNASSTSITAGQSVSFSVSKESGNVDVSQTGWTISGSPAGAGAELTYTFNSAGTYEVKATLGGVSESVTVVVADAPQTSLTWSAAPSEATVNAQVTFSVSVQNGASDQVQWSVNGPESKTASGGSASFSFGQEGTYTVTASLNGVSVSAQISVKAESGTDPAPEG